MQLPYIFDIDPKDDISDLHLQAQNLITQNFGKIEEVEAHANEYYITLSNGKTIDVEFYESTAKMEWLD